VNRVAIIGCGPRGLSVLERVVAHAPRYEDRLEVVVIEPGELGTGVHSPAQPDYLMLNSVAGQATAFGDAAMVPGVSRAIEKCRWIAIEKCRSLMASEAL
jgi:uncharacterized NAD(P)/FAD-binding protein YdhS